MRDWLITILLVLCFTFVVALAGPTVEEITQDRGLPTTPEIWDECCSDEECREATIQATWIDPEWMLIKINDMEPFKIESSKVMNSINGQAYYCRISIFHRLTGENIRCVFLTGERLA